MTRWLLAATAVLVLLLAWVAIEACLPDRFAPPMARGPLFYPNGD
jgi:hypothetical protein